MQWIVMSDVLHDFPIFPNGKKSCPLLEFTCQLIRRRTPHNRFNIVSGLGTE
jgi:hypothetical protein